MKDKSHGHFSRVFWRVIRASSSLSHQPLPPFLIAAFFVNDNDLTSRYFFDRLTKEPGNGEEKV